MIDVLFENQLENLQLIDSCSIKNVSIWTVQRSLTELRLNSRIVAKKPLVSKII